MTSVTLWKKWFSLAGPNLIHTVLLVNRRLWLQCLSGDRVSSDGDLSGLTLVSGVLGQWRLGDSRLKALVSRVLLCPKRGCGQGMCSVALCNGGGTAECEK